jgi:LPS export ABC transporter protein LptC
MRGRKAVFLFLILVSVGFLAYKVAENVWARKLHEFEKNPVRLLDTLPEAALQLKDFRRTKIDRGRKVWEVWGQEARYMKDQREVVVQHPRFAYFQENGAVLEAAAEEGRLFLSEQDVERMELSGSIVLSYRGFHLATEKIVYLRDEQKVLLPQRVVLKGEGLELEGVGVEIALQDEKIRVLNSVKTKIHPGEAGGLRRALGSDAKPPEKS